ncbi:MotA/TolQ/ExbB proton channel family protein [candidate division KSB1 bacterium]|nr:MotA/TolQ/ExbB proton channel family protein [candidate division KSB1 bacterium]
MVKKKYVLGGIIFLFVLILQAGLVWAQAEPTPETETSGTNTIETFWQLTEKAGIFRWPLFLTFIIGIIVIIRKSVALFIDWKKASPLYRLDFKRYKDLGQVSLLAKQKPSNAANLVEILLETLKTSPDAAKFNEELEKFTDIQKQHFSTFQNRMAFWSDTAGALGLLGTVWGMFQTFFKGDMDQQVILSGMGIALITTFMGLVISVILNFCTTEVSGSFNRYLKNLAELSERLWRQVIEIRPSMVIGTDSKRVPVTASAQLEQPEPATPISKKEVTEKVVQIEEVEEPVQYKLIPVSGDEQKIMINQKLAHPLIVECLQIKGTKKVVKSGEKILFESLNNMGIFENGESIIDVQTDTSGRAEVFFTPQKQNGSCQIQVTHPEHPEDPVHFNYEVIVSEPTDFRIKTGNNQSASAGQKLPAPIVIEVLDDSGNLIPSCIVHFQVEMGDGKFTNNKSFIDAETDNNGLASAEFTSGRTPGFNAIQVSVEQIEKKRISIQALGQ